MSAARLLAAACALAALAACRREDPAPGAAQPPPSASTTPTPATAPQPPSAPRDDSWPASERPELVEAQLAPTGDLKALVRAESTRATADGRRLVIYVGATWCDPCRRFHDALKAGSLHAAFPKVRFLELDADRHARPIRDAGCQSDFIPLFALPGPDGTCASTARVAGGVKGDGAVANLVPRVQALLAGAPTD